MTNFISNDLNNHSIMKDQYNEHISAVEDIRSEGLVLRDCHTSNVYHKNIYLDEMLVEDCDSEINPQFKEIMSLINCLLKKANDWYHSFNFDDAKTILECMLPVSWELPTTLGNLEGLICQYLGAISCIQNRPEAAIYLHYKDLLLSRACKDASSVAKAYGNIGLCLLCSNYYKFATYYFQEQAAICGLINDQQDLAWAYGNLGVLYSEMKEAEKAVINFSMSLALGEALQDKKLIGISSGKLALTRQSLGQFAVAAQNYDICYKNNIEIGDFRGACCAKSNLASCLRGLGQYHESIIASKACIEMQTSSFDQLELGVNLETVNIANAYFSIKEYSQCLDAASQSLNRFSLLRRNLNERELKYILEKENFMYSWIIVSQIKLGLYLESLLSCEKIRQRNFLDYTGREKSANVDNSEYSIESLHSAIVGLKEVSLYYQIITTETSTSTVVIWLIIPPGKRKNNQDIEIHTKLVDLKNFYGEPISDVKSWVFQLRQMTGLRGWKTVHQISQENINSKISTKNNVDKKDNNIWENLSQMFLLKLYANIFGSILQIFGGVFAVIGMILLSLAILPSPVYFFISLFSIFDGFDNDNLNSKRGKNHGSNHHKLIRKLHMKYNPDTIKRGFNLPNSYALVACKEFYDVLFRPFENILNEVLSDGDTLLLLLHDVMTLVPFQAMMNSEEIYLISKYKLRQSPSLILEWQLQKRSGYKRHVAHHSSDCGIHPNSDRLLQSVHIGGKTMAPNRPQHLKTSDEFSVISNLLHRQNIPFKSFRSKIGANIDDVRGSLQQSSLLHLSSVGSTCGALVLHSHGSNTEEYLQAKDIYDWFLNNGSYLNDDINCFMNIEYSVVVAFAVIFNGEICPDIVILKLYVTNMKDNMLCNVDGIIRVLLSCGVSSVITTIGDVQNEVSQHIMSSFYSLLLGLKDGERKRVKGLTSMTSDNFDSVEALQTAALKYMAMDNNYTKPDLWSSYIVSGIPVDLKGPKTLL